MTAARPDAIVIAKANCGVPTVHGDHIHYSGTPELMADYVRLAIDAGARIIGGCCGTSPAHLAAMRAALDAHVKAARPTREEVVARDRPTIWWRRRSARSARNGRASRAARARGRAARRACRRGTQLGPLHHAAAAARRGALRGGPRDHRAQCRDPPPGDRHRFQGAPARAPRSSRSAGCDVDGWRVRFPRGLARKLVATAPREFTQHARNPARSVPIGGKATVFAPVYGSPFVHDLDQRPPLRHHRGFPQFREARLPEPLHPPLGRHGLRAGRPAGQQAPSRDGLCAYALVRQTLYGLGHPSRARRGHGADVGDPLRRGIRRATTRW